MLRAMSGYTQIPVPGPPEPVGRGHGARDHGSHPRCTWCGAGAFEPGFIEDAGGSMGFARWIVGELEKGIFGGAARFGRPRLDITGLRCTTCGHLSFFAR